MAHAPALRTSLDSDKEKLLAIAKKLGIDIVDKVNRINNDMEMLKLIDKIKLESVCRIPDESGAVLELYALDNEVRRRDNDAHHEMRIIDDARQRFMHLDERLRSVTHHGRLVEVLRSICEHPDTAPHECDQIKQFLRKHELVNV